MFFDKRCVVLWHDFSHLDMFIYHVRWKILSLSSPRNSLMLYVSLVLLFGVLISFILVELADCYQILIKKILLFFEVELMEFSFIFLNPFICFLSSFIFFWMSILIFSCFLKEFFLEWSATASNKNTLKNILKKY